VDGAALAVTEVEAGQCDAGNAARPDTEGEPGGDAQERPDGQAAEETLIFEPSRAEDEGLTEDMAQEAPGVEGAPISEPIEARDEGTVAIVPVPTAQEGATAVVELPDSSGEYGDSMDIDPAAAASAAAHIVEFASASAGVLEAGASEASHLGVIVPSGVPSEFLRKEQEEEEALNKQMGVGREILQALDRAYQLHQNADYQVSQVSISPGNCFGLVLTFRASSPTPSPFAAAEGNLAREERRDEPAVLPDEPAQATQRRAGAQKYRRQHQNGRSGGASAGAGGGAGAGCW